MPLIGVAPLKDTSIIVVIPCLAEPEIEKTLTTLSENKGYKGHAEVIVVVNEPENAREEIRQKNRETVDSLSLWMGLNRAENVSYYLAGPVKLPSKWAGVGLARKKGMDEALYRFNQLDKPKGIIVSLDADTLVEANYFEAIESHFAIHKGDVGATLSFSHRKEGLPEKQLAGIIFYEKYLHYYKDALTYTGYPNALITIGSAFAVTAQSYLKRGGMNRRKAGEDFYFLQTLTQLGHVGNITGTCVHPSARISQRVPFGTGMEMKKWMEGSRDLQRAFNVQAFRDLKILFSQRGLFFGPLNAADIIQKMELPGSLNDFAASENLWEEIDDLRKNCRTSLVFNHRFYQLFNAFRVLKFLHFSHPHYYPFAMLDDCIAGLRSENREPVT